MEHVASKQRDFSSLVNLAGHQAGLANRVAYFASLMAATEDEAEFDMARSQVGRTVNKIKAAHNVLRNGNPEKNIPKVTNKNLQTIYDDPMVGLDLALNRFLERAQQVYESDMETLDTGSASYLFLTTYGPHVLEPLLEAAVDEYEIIGRDAIIRIENLELIIWLAALATLLVEIGFIFRPMERKVQNSLCSLESSISELEQTKERLLSAQHLALVGDWELNAATKTLTLSDQACQICSLDPKAFKGTQEAALALVHPEDQPMVKKAIESLLKDKTSMDVEYRIICPDGDERLVYQYTRSADAGNGKKILATIQDITERKELSTRLEKLSENVPGFIFIFRMDPQENSWFPYASKGAFETCGIHPENLKHDSRPLFDLFHKKDLADVMKTIRQSSRNLEKWHDQYRIRHPEKGPVFLEGHATPERLSDGGTIWYGYIWDITERKHSENQIRRLALYDPLTSLANRRLLLDRLAHAIALSRRNQNYGAVLMLDLDNFKSLNDTKGHNVGDALLCEVAKRLNACGRETDTVARLGGDEFVVILEELGTHEKEGRKTALALAEKIRRSLNSAYIIGDEGHVHHSSVSIGVALFQEKDTNESEVLKRADVAMYEAKDLGRNRCCLYSEVRQALVNNRTVMTHDLQLGLENKEFTLYLQPQFSNTGEIFSAEALIRWLPRGKPPVSPGEFIPIAENTGLILPIGEWVLEQACRYLNDLNDQGLPSTFTLAVNISARQFIDDRFVEKVRKILDRHQVAPGQLKFELTETCLVQDMERGQAILNTLRTMGLSIELDDFGTGYSSFNSINKLPFTALKLDRSLIKGIEQEEPNRAIVRAAIAMAKAMSLITIAEGVETKIQSDFLIKEGCEMLQGFFFARPMPYPDFKSFLAKKQVTAASPEKLEKIIPMPGSLSAPEKIKAQAPRQQRG